MSPDLSGFYGTCAQIIPALLIVVALETKTASRAVGEARAAPETAALVVDWLDAHRDEAPRRPVAAMKMLARNWGRWGHLTRIWMQGVIWFGLLCEVIAVMALAFPPAGALRTGAVGLLLTGIALIGYLAARGLADALTAKAEPFTAAATAEARETLAENSSKAQGDSA
ncbi:hypothetical protein [Myceligenerans cantabricum]